MNKLGLVVVFLMVWAVFSSSYAAMYFYNVQALEKQIADLKSLEQTVSLDKVVVVMVNFGNGTSLAKVVHFTLGTGFSAFNATEEAFGEGLEYKYFEEYGDVFVTRFFDVANDANSSKYWSIYVNGTPSASGALKTLVSPDDVIEWKYQKL
ncbi:MAG: DUF4430 domain-containing protein [Nitrososphaeria archaeon]